MEKEYFNQETIVLAHRGAPREFPENTLPSFKRASELNIDVLETDVHFTKDKKFVVLHDEYLERTTNGTGKAIDYTMQELKKLDAGYKFSHNEGKTYPFRDKGITLLSLEELFNEFPGHRFNIELKTKNPKQVEYYGKTIRQFNAETRVLTASEHISNLKALRKLIPQMATSFSPSEVIKFLLLSKSGLLFLKSNFDGDALQIPENVGKFRIVTSTFIRHAHDKGIKVHVWTINEEDDMRRLLDMGTDGIFTDIPLLLIKVLGRI